MVTAAHGRSGFLVFLLLETLRGIAAVGIHYYPAITRFNRLTGCELSGMDQERAAPFSFVRGPGL
jgi:hypothetical protein